MRVIQSLNQNALLVLDDQNEEVVALGKGLGFGKKKGDEVDSRQISRVFAIQSSTHQKKLLDSLKEIDTKMYEIAEEVVALAEKELGKTLHQTFVITMAKHLSFAMERQQQEQIEYDPVQFQLNYLYPDEYRISALILQKINEKYHLHFKKQEVSFFTLHLVNGLIDSEDFRDLFQLSDMLEQIIAFLDQKGPEKLDKDSVHYSRFLVHLRYFLIRSLSKESKNTDEDKMMGLLDLTQEMYPVESNLLKGLKEMLVQEYQLQFGIDEELYVLLHLVRMFRKEVA